MQKISLAEFISLTWMYYDINLNGGCYVKEIQSLEYENPNLKCSETTFIKSYRLENGTMELTLVTSKFTQMFLVQDL